MSRGKTMVSGTVGFNRQFRKQTPLNYASQWTRMKPRAAQRGVLLRPVRHKNKINGKTPKMSHITPKPLELVERIVRASSNEGDLILDCFVGSGTTAFVAKKIRRNFICSDNNKSYVVLTNKKLKSL